MIKKIYTFGICLGMSICAFSQQRQTDSLEAEQLNEVVITDSRFKLKRESSGKTVIKISETVINRNQGRTISELINAKSGIEINGSRGNAGNNLGYFIRGGNNRKVLVVIDGIQVNDPASIANDFDLRLLNLNQVESIEIIKGAASTLYGNSGASAVINITTKSASSKKVAATFKSTLGTNQSQNGQNYNIANFNNAVSVDGTLSKFNYVIGFSQEYSDGFSAFIGEENDAFSKYNVNLKFGYNFSEDISVKIYGNYDDINSDIDGFSVSNFSRIDTPLYSFTNEQKRVGITSKYKYKGGSTEVNASYLNNKRNIVDGFGANFNSHLFVVDAFNKYNFNDTFYTILGFNYTDSKTNFMPEKRINMADPYANVVWVSNFGFNINVGARLNNHSEYGSSFTYNFNPSYRYKFNSNYVKIFGSYSTSFIAPSLYNLYGDFVANSDLEAETNRTLEFGSELSLNNKLRFSALYFNRKETDAIDYDSNTTFTYVNINGDIAVNGVEVELDYKPLNRLNLNANYTFTERNDEGVAFFPLVRIPKHKVNANINYRFSRHLQASVSYQYVSDRADTFETLKAFSLVGFNINYNLIENKLILFANVDNLFNENYLEVRGFTTKGRNVNVGFNLRL